MQRITQGAAVQVGVCEVGVEFDGPGVVALGAFEVAQAGFEHGTQVIDLDIAGRVERHAVEVVECAVVIADLGAENRPVEIGERVGRVQLEYPVEIREGLHRTVGVGIDHRPVEIGRQESRVAADRHVEIGFGSGILLFLQQQGSALVIAVGIFAVGADRLVEIFQGPYGVLQVQVGCAAADVGVGYLVFLEDEFVEILDRLLVLLVLQARIAPAVIGVRQVGPQVDRLAEILQRVVVVAHARTGQRPVDVGGREYGVFDDGSRKVGIGTQQVVEVEFGYAPQEIALCGVRIGPQQDVEHTNRLLIFAVHQATAAGPVEIVFVVLGVGSGGVAQQRPQ